MIRQTLLASFMLVFVVAPQISRASEATNTSPANAVRMCVEECLAFYDAPSAELKKCVSSCSRLAELPTVEIELPQTPVPAN